VASLAEPLACAVQAMEECTAFHVGDTVLLTGPGPIGLLCLLLIAAHGCKVIVAGAGADEERLALARKLGADRTINVEKENLEEVVRRETGGRGVDITIDCTGVASAINSCLKMVRGLGQHIQVGIVGKEIMLDYDKIFAKKLTVFGSNAHSLKTWDRVMRIFAQGKIDVKPLISHTLPLSKWEEGFALCERKQGIKVLLTYDE
jgi:L-iditol 2-dehydrogenase